MMQANDHGLTHGYLPGPVQEPFPGHRLKIVEFISPIIPRSMLDSRAMWIYLLSPLQTNGSVVQHQSQDGCWSEVEQQMKPRERDMGKSSKPRASSSSYNSLTTTIFSCSLQLTRPAPRYPAGGNVSSNAGTSTSTSTVQFHRGVHHKRALGSKLRSSLCRTIELFEITAFLSTTLSNTREARHWPWISTSLRLAGSLKRRSSLPTQSSCRRPFYSSPTIQARS